MEGGSCSRSVATGERIHLPRDKGSYTMDVGVAAVEVLAMSSGDEHGFIGQA